MPMEANDTQFDAKAAERFADEFSAGVAELAQGIMEDDHRVRPLQAHVKALELYTAGILFGLRDQLAKRTTRPDLTAHDIECKIQQRMKQLEREDADDPRLRELSALQGWILCGDAYAGDPAE